ncbi:methyltransferase family protein [Actinomadura sp. 3N407]|uniref:methyltransferase family protein n=1 Tax=Actinomadura sp. 3N407 TaxID=3457423 RepID=UPI003FCE7790
MFSVIRHPIYTGLTVFLLGWGLAWSSPATVVGALILFVFFDFKARREERWLEAQFAGYATYKRQAKKLVPFIY